MKISFSKKVSLTAISSIVLSTSFVGHPQAFNTHISAAEKKSGLVDFLKESSTNMKIKLSLILGGAIGIGSLSTIAISHFLEKPSREQYDAELAKYKQECQKLKDDISEGKYVPSERYNELQTKYDNLNAKYAALSADPSNKDSNKAIEDLETRYKGQIEDKDKEINELRAEISKLSGHHEIPPPESEPKSQLTPPPLPPPPPPLVVPLKSLCDKYKVKYQSPKPAAPRTTATVANIPPKGPAVSVVLLPKMRTSHVKSLSNKQLIKDYITNHPNFNLESLSDADLIRVKLVFDESKIGDFKEYGALTNDVLAEKILSEGEFDTSKVDDIIECLALYNKLSDKSNFEVDINISDKKVILQRRLFNQKYIDATGKYSDRFSSLHTLVDNDGANDEIHKILIDNFIKPTVALFDKLTPGGLYERLVVEKLNAFFNGITDVSKLKEIGTADAPSALLKRFIDRSTKVADRLDKINSNELMGDLRTLIVHMFSTHNMSDNVISSLADAMVAANNS